MREVKRSAGYRVISLSKPLNPSYHTYSWKGISYLKKTNWFLMKYDGDMITEPQTEEGITKVEWLYPDEINAIKKQCMAVVNGYYQLFSTQRLND